MVSFVNFARIASICVRFHLGTLQGYLFHQDFWPNLNFLLEYQIKLVLNFTKFLCFKTYFTSTGYSLETPKRRESKKYTLSESSLQDQFGN